MPSYDNLHANDKTERLLGRNTVRRCNADQLLIALCEHPAVQHH